MPDSLEITQKAIEDFSKVQRRMLLAKEENATKWYADFKEEYLNLKALLNTASVNLTEIDRIKEWYLTLFCKDPSIEYMQEEHAFTYSALPA